MDKEKGDHYKLYLLDPDKTNTKTPDRMTIKKNGLIVFMSVNVTNEKSTYYYFLNKKKKVINIIFADFECKEYQFFTRFKDKTFFHGSIKFKKQKDISELNKKMSKCIGKILDSKDEDMKKQFAKLSKIIMELAKNDCFENNPVIDMKPKNTNVLLKKKKKHWTKLIKGYELEKDSFWEDMGEEDQEDEYQKYY